MKKFVPILKSAVTLYCIIFTVATIVNSVAVLHLGLSSNPNVHEHIMTRAVIVFVITAAIILVAAVMRGILSTSKTKKSVLFKYTVVCIVILLLIFVYVWALSTGRLWVSAEELHPDAFRDMSRSILIPAAALAIVGFFVMMRRTSNEHRRKHFKA